MAQISSHPFLFIIIDLVHSLFRLPANSKNEKQQTTYSWATHKSYNLTFKHNIDLSKFCVACKITQQQIEFAKNIKLTIGLPCNN